MIYGNYVHTKKVNLDLEKIRESSKAMSHFIFEQFGNDEPRFSTNSPAITKLYASYNLLMYPLPEFHELFQEICTFFKEIQEEGDDKKYYMQCWLNIYHKGEFIDWHDHWPTASKAWHGFYCVYSGSDSGTHYRVPPDGEEYFIPSKDNFIIMSKSDGDQHKSTEWNDETNPRVTIAFDIVPRECIDGGLNHWIPIL